LEIVLARGEKDRRSFVGAAVVESGLPEVACQTFERLHTATAHYAHSCSDCFGDERRIKRLASFRHLFQISFDRLGERKSTGQQRSIGPLFCSSCLSP
jgi:hypothetical protein